MSANPLNFEPNINLVVSTVTVSNILSRAYRMAGALGVGSSGKVVAGRGLSNSESAEGLQVLNAMMDGWKAESLMIPYTRRSVQNLVATQQSYGVGPGQDFDIERPSKITRAGYIIGTYPNDAEIPMRIVLTYQEWSDAIIVKHVPSSLPLVLYYEDSTPFGTARFWPIPNVNLQIAIYTPQYIQEFATVDDVIEVPYGFREGIIYNLSVRIHEMYPSKPMDPMIAQRAEMYKNRMKALMFLPTYIAADPAAMQESRWNSLASQPPKSWIPY